MALIDQIYSRVDLGKYMGSASLSLFGHNFVIWIECNGPNFEILFQKFNENFAPLIFQGQNKNYPVWCRSPEVLSFYRKLCCERDQTNQHHAKSFVSNYIYF